MIEDTVQGEVVEELPLGKGLEGLLRDTSMHTHEFRYGGFRWVVRYTKLSWEDHFNAVEKGWKSLQIGVGDDGQPAFEREFAAAEYYERVLLLAVHDINGEKPTPTVLRQFDAAVITQLITLVPSPLLGVEVEEAKKD